ncbi:MAG: hypothetical protein QOG88_293 [Actinomycetota bacterium]|jgi:hypothetical protein|nr:hypothetical protein [Actinomycetota bacterium]
MKRHRFDPFSFLFGMLFLVLGVTFWFRPDGDTAPRLHHLGPPAVIVVGLTLACWAFAAAFRRPDQTPKPGSGSTVDSAANGGSDTAPE